MDSAFIDSLNVILFDKKCSAADYKPWQYFHLSFEQKDALNYSIYILLARDGGKNSKGFFEQNGYLYWFRGDVPSGIILGAKSERQFSYKKATPPRAETYDPPFWFLTYNCQTGKIRVDERPCN